LSFILLVENDKDAIVNDASNSSGTNKDVSTSITIDKDKKVNRTQLGAIGNNPSMMKLFELIRASYETYKTMLNSSDNDRFGQLLSTALTCMMSVLKLVSMQDILKHLEETLNYLKSTFNIDNVKTMQCTQEVINECQLIFTVLSNMNRVDIYN
jgi:hypothetical protein